SQRWVEWAGELGVGAASDFEDNHFPPATRRLGYWTRRSRDGGRTWDEPTPAPVSAPHGANLLPNGDLIYIGTMPGVDSDGKHSLGVAISADQGVTWTVAARINAAPQVPGTVAGEKPRLCEPHVVATASGKLLGLARYQVKDVKQRVLWQFESPDGGKTWTEPQPASLLGFPPHLLRLRDDRILVSHAIRHQPPGQRFCLSADEGLTWDIANQLTLQDAPDGDLGYPASVELDDGTLLSVYYQKERAGEKPCLMSTHWRA
ncbi:MAG: glycoside hydrolase, partial [Lentisphaerae bacterium]|nr:glycoside hydrolase [Lentisphaerota bacterium]